MARTLRLVSYNIRKAVGLDRRRVPERILDVVNRLDGDVVLLQEADRRLGERPAAVSRDLIERDSDYRVVPLAANDVSLGWHGNAVLVRKGVTVVDAARLDLPGLEPRGAVLVDLETPIGRLGLVGAHLGLLRPWRRMQIREILDKLGDARLARSVVAGDFNEWSDKQGLEPFEGSHTVISPGKSFHAGRPVAALDRVALGSGLSLTGAGVDESPLARTSSDHLPVWAEIRSDKAE